MTYSYPTTLEDKAHKLGRSASFFATTFEDADTATAYLAGDFELDAPAPLSGEWAGEPVSSDVLAYLEVADEDDAVDDVLSAYEDGFFTRFYELADASANAIAWKLDHPAVGKVVDFGGVAARVRKAREDGTCIVVMVGDDYEHRADLSDLNYTASSYCLECGQIGCGSNPSEDH